MYMMTKAETALPSVFVICMTKSVEHLNLFCSLDDLTQDLHHVCGDND